VALRCVENLKTLLSPFLPFSSQRLHEMLGGEGTLASMPELIQTQGADGSHHVLTGSYTVGGWRASRLPAGLRLGAPRPLFRKLEDAIIDHELQRMTQQAARPD
jgi:methionyl-tRNA synthetase